MVVQVKEYRSVYVKCAHLAWHAEALHLV
jgi:hypothetical protein